jgi:iron(II)-dependent oxidoreductase
MRLVPAGKFWQGCNEVAEGKVTCQYDEYPQHEVFVSGFWFDVYTASVSQYAECVATAVCDKPKWLHGVAKEHAELYNWGAKGRDKHPINGVTWYQAKTYCAWRHKGGRLATESEWEKTARGGCDVNKGASCKAAMRAYPWGNAKPTCMHAVVSNDGQARQTDFGCGKGTTWPVGAKPTDVGP